MVNISSYETTIVVGDLHIPLQDKRAVNVVLDYIEVAKPDRVIINGDLMDFFTTSKFAAPHEVEGLLDDLEQSELFLHQLRQVHKGEIDYTEGNHDYRLQWFLRNKAPQLLGLPQLRLESLLKLGEYKVKYHASGSKLAGVMEYGPELLIGHWSVALQGAGRTANKLMLKYGKSIIQGHTHRLAKIVKRQDNRVLGGYEGGCLCDLNPTYVDKPDWAHGFCMVHKKKNSSRFHVEIMEIIKGKFVVGGKEWGG
jgi:UDP-2,3-diacylglucosamine pyrophosphatase LpxH